MHKKFFLALSLLACMGVTACNNGGGDGGGEEPPAPDPTAELQYSDTKVVDNALLKANAEIGVDPYVDERYHAEVVASPTKDLDVVDARYEAYGLQVVRGENGYIGFYSLLQNDWLLAPRFTPEDPYFQYNVRTNGTEGVGFILEVTFVSGYSQDRIVVDGFGNTFDWGVDPDYFSHESVDSKYYLIGRYYNDQYSELIYEYDNDGHCRSVSYVPDSSGQGGGESSEDFFYDGPFYDRLYKEGWLDLSYIGMTGKAVAWKKGYYTIFDNEVAVSSFYVDESNKLIGVINGAMYFQKSVQLPDTALIYSYSEVPGKSEVARKYALTQFMYSLSSGERTELHFPVKFEQFEVLNPTLTGGIYQVVSYQPIVESLILGDKVSYVADKDFVLHDNVSGAHIGDFVRYVLDPSVLSSKDRYFNTETKVLYDENFKVITYLGDMEPVYKNCFNMFEGTKDGKKGLVDLNGKVRLEFRYDTIEYDSFYGNAGLVTRGDKVFKVSLVTGDEELVGYDLESYYSDLEHSAAYIYKEYDSDNAPTVVYSVKNGELLTASEQLASKVYLGKYRVVYARDYSSNKVRVVKYEDFIPQAIPSTTKGEATEEALIDGSTPEKAMSIDIGVNNGVYIRGLEEIYVKLEAESASQNGYYYLQYNRDEIRYIGATVDGENYDTVDYYWTTNYSVVGVEVEYGKTIIFEFAAAFTYSETSHVYEHLKDVATIRVEKALGVEEEHPLVCDAVGTVYTAQIPYHYSHSSPVTNVYDFYATFTAPEAGMYRYIAHQNAPSALFIVGEDSETRLADVDMPMSLAAGESVTLRIHSSTLISSTSFRFAKYAYEVATYDSTTENYLSVAEGHADCSTFIVTFTAPSEHGYRVRVGDPNIVDRVYVNGHVTNGVFSANENEVVTLIVVTNTEITSGNQVAYVIEEYDIPVNPYVISLDANGSSATYPWIEDEGVYTSSNAGYNSTNSSMTITFSANGTFSFKYKSYGENNYDYLVVSKNGEQLFNCQGLASSTFYDHELSVVDGDVLTFTFRKDTSSSSYDDNAQIKDLNFVLA